jgi:hypothetical protein
MVARDETRLAFAREGREIAHMKLWALLLFIVVTASGCAHPKERQLAVVQGKNTVWERVNNMPEPKFVWPSWAPTFSP